MSLIITVDNGISAVEPIQRANELGLDVIVSDHHHIPDTLPKAYAIVHPAFPRSFYCFHELSGAGVAFKLSQALLGRFPNELLPYVAVATIADVMPLVGENRILVKLGLEELNRNADLGLYAIGKVAGLEDVRINAEHIAFQFSPRINSVGRLSHASMVVDLFLTEDYYEAIALAEQMNGLNRFRQALQEAVETDALAQIEAHPEWLNDRTLVIAGEHYHEGVVGICAGKIA